MTTQTTPEQSPERGVGAEASVSTFPPNCDPDIFAHGEVIAVLDGRPQAIEGIVRTASTAILKLDWHYVGGRAIVRTLGDITAARKALEAAMPQILS